LLRGHWGCLCLKVCNLVSKIFVAAHDFIAIFSCKTKKTQEIFTKFM